MKFLDRELTDRTDRSHCPRAEVYRLADGQIVYMERDINVAGWARITRLAKSASSTAVAPGSWCRWTYASAADAASALAEWDPESAPAPAGWFLCGQAKQIT
jgi:hypothetical protein